MFAPSVFILRHLNTLGCQYQTGLVSIFLYSIFKASIEFHKKELVDMQQSGYINTGLVQAQFTDFFSF